MALTHFVDTSVLTRLGQPTVRDVVEPLLAAGRAARAGISDLEIGFSARNAREWDKLAVTLSVFDLLETTTNHMRRARQVQRMPAKASQRGRKIPDLLIAAAAEETGLILLHYDHDYDHIAAATGQPTEWVAPPGSID